MFQQSNLYGMVPIPIGRHSSTLFSRRAAAGGYHGHASQVYGPLTMSPGISDETVTRFVAGCGGLEWAGLMVV